MRQRKTARDDLMETQIDETIRLAEILQLIERIEAHVRETKQNVQDALSAVQQRLGETLLAAGMGQIRRRGWMVRLQQEENVVVGDLDLVPDECIYVETSVSKNPLWGKIRRTIKNGEKVPGARLVKEPVTVRMSRMKGSNG